MAQHGEQFRYIQYAAAAYAHHQIKSGIVDVSQQSVNVVMRGLWRHALNHADAAVIGFQQGADSAGGLQTGDITVGDQ